MLDKVRFHLPSLLGQPVGGPESDPTCPFTTKVRLFPKMMQALGHEVIVYGDPRHAHDGEHVSVYDPKLLEDKDWNAFNDDVAKALRERAEPGDVLGIVCGTFQSSLLDNFPDLLHVEYGLGHSFPCDGTYKVFESYACMHTAYALNAGLDKFNNAVINPYFDLDDFCPPARPEDYLLYVGRLTEDKGLQIACEAASRLDIDLIIAGDGGFRPEYGDYIGVINHEERADLMTRARALICPTLYVEPFAYVHAEAQLCGCPVISTDWGAFTETIQQGETGYRCRSIDEFVEAIENVRRLDREKIRQDASSKWSLETIGYKYDAYFKRLIS